MGPVLIEAVVDPFKAAHPPDVMLKQATQFAAAPAKGPRTGEGSR